MEPDESLFDEYARQLAEGVAASPEQFLSAHPTASADLRAALERMFRRAPRGGSADGALPFERLGEFKLVRRLGGGGMGIVFLAVQESLGREVALKILRPELQGSAVAAERFHREARALAELRHENLVAVFGGGDEKGVRYLAMELARGDALDELIKGGKLGDVPIARRVRWIAGLARGLQHAHERGVVHRDVKPANVRITPDDRALLLDFGLARSEGLQATTLTQSFAGTPSYAAPEQIQESGVIDARTDVYALGVTLYQCLAGRLPYDGDTVERLFHRILTATPAPLRKLAPAVPRDLETVTHKAFERRPERRYASAADFADDLDAVLELRPIRARPPDLLQRGRRLLRSHPLLATALATALVAAVVLSSVLGAQRRAREQAVRDEAARLVATARDRIADYRARRESLSSVQREVSGLLVQIEAQTFTDEEYALIDRYEAQLESERRAWEETYYEVLDLVRQAERIDPAVAGGDAARGELYLARYREATDLAQPIEAQFFRALAAKSDPALARALAAEAEVTITSDPPGADVWLFRLQELSRLRAGGEPRMVAVPVQETPVAIDPGTFALRVTRDAPPLRRGDLVIEIEGAPIEGSLFVIDGGGQLGAGERLVAVDGKPVRDDWDAAQLSAPSERPRRFEFAHGGASSVIEAHSLDELGIEVGAAGRFGVAAGRDAVRCRVVRDGATIDALLPPAAPVRATARPLFTSPACHAGRSPVTLRAPSGEYLFVLRRDGHVEVRAAFPIGAPATLHFPLPAQDAAPDGFVFIPETSVGGSDDYWIMEREVTAAEWREFLRDPATRTFLATAGWSRLVPRHTGQPNPYWTRAPDGSWTWPPNWAPDWPVVGISWEDARDYVAWRNRTANHSKPVAAELEYALPTQADIVHAATGRLSWRFVYGQRLRPRWSRCCFARPNANLGPVLEFPVDESPSGVFDLTGGAFEWLDHWYDEPRDMRMLAGGAWGQAKIEHLSVSGGMGVQPSIATGETGVRLVLRRRQAGGEPPK